MELIQFDTTAKAKLEKLLGNPNLNIPPAIVDGLKRGIYTVTPKVYHAVKAINGKTNIQIIGLSDVADNKLHNLNNGKITSGTIAFVHNVALQYGETSETDATVAGAVDKVASWGHLSPLLQNGASDLKFGKQEVYDKTSNASFCSTVAANGVEGGDMQFVPRVIDDKTNIEWDIAWNASAPVKGFMRATIHTLVITANTIGL